MLHTVFEAGGFASNSVPYPPKDDYAFQYNLNLMRLFANSSSRHEPFELSDHLSLEEGKVCIPELYDDLAWNTLSSTLLWQIAFTTLGCTNCAEYVKSVLSTMSTSAEQKKSALKLHISTLTLTLAQETKQSSSDPMQCHNTNTALQKAEAELLYIETALSNIESYRICHKDKVEKLAQESSEVMKKYQIELMPEYCATSTPVLPDSDLPASAAAASREDAAQRTLPDASSGDDSAQKLMDAPPGDIVLSSAPAPLIPIYHQANKKRSNSSH